MLRLGLEFVEELLMLFMGEAFRVLYLRGHSVFDLLHFPDVMLIGLMLNVELVEMRQHFGTPLHQSINIIINIAS